MLSHRRKYRLGNILGRGGMADVHIAKQWGDDGFERICAIKKIQPSLSAERSFLNLFRDEARICQSLHHSNVLQIFDLLVIDGCQAMVMEFIDGIDLKSLIRVAGQKHALFPVPAAVMIAAEVARGLHYAHTRRDERTGGPLGIVHRDVTPENVMVSFDGDVKLTDFGVATAVSKVENTEPGTIKGKFAYMSPEQIASRKLDGRSDVFSLGLVLWECLAMRRLIPDWKPAEILKAISKFSYQPCQRPNHEPLDPDLDVILRRALARDPANRYASAEAFERDLRLFLSTKYPSFTSSTLAQYVRHIGIERRAAHAKLVHELLNCVDSSPDKPSEVQIDLRERGPVYQSKGGFAVPKPVTSRVTPSQFASHQRMISAQARSRGFVSGGGRRVARARQGSQFLKTAGLILLLLFATRALLEPRIDNWIATVSGIRPSVILRPAILQAQSARADIQKALGPVWQQMASRLPEVREANLRPATATRAPQPGALPHPNFSVPDRR